MEKSSRVLLRLHRGKKHGGFYPDQAIKIESLKRLRQLHRACFKLSYKDESGNVVTFNSNFFDPANPAKRKKGKIGPQHKKRSFVTWLVAHWRRKILPDYVQGLCIFCGDLVLSEDTTLEPAAILAALNDGAGKTVNEIAKAMRRPGSAVLKGLKLLLDMKQVNRDGEGKRGIPFVYSRSKLCEPDNPSGDTKSPTVAHIKCFNDWQQGRCQHGRHNSLSLLSEQPRRGVRAKRGDLIKHFGWTIRHKLGGESLESIAKKAGASKSTVVDGIDYIMSRLPKLELVPKKLRKQVQLLLATKAA